MKHLKFPVVFFSAYFMFINSAAAANTNEILNFSKGLTPNSSVQLFLLVTLLSLSSSLVLMFTHFTYFIIVLGLTRQGLGVMNLPPNQVLVGLALFLTLFTMQPVITELKTEVWDPMQREELTSAQVIEKSTPILKSYLTKHTYEHDLKMMLKVRNEVVPEKPEQLSLLTLVPSFALTQIQKGLLTGMFIYLAFVFIDLIISTLLMYLGMMMVPPMILSLPFKILVFIYVGGYTKVVDIMFKTVS
ncbi:flagellar biosynthesis protein flip [Ectobacillus sp. JY-23]|uniref:flagellar biosynthesis protein flip n=1 Tax=Ectobacillus sp. JY-23 TaxID=2933872 RepID=UPI001FF514E7|nr:flagellar biosynthesis protein flip [Ectobacillus sp. JY-23]UOY93368.1 flagellar biosynthesis protein flip [Ectobacillus sp. JY-23]